MKCKFAETLMMQYFEKTIAPKNASKLAKHVLTCEPCRELYLTFDEAAENAEELAFAPMAFAAEVMTAVRAEAAFSRKKMETRTFAPRILAAVNMLLFAAGLVFAPHISQSFPRVEIGNALRVAYFAQVAAAHAADRIAQAEFSAYGVSALLIALLTGTLLFVLHRGDEKINI